jgi:hypothetical protein
MKLNNLTVKTEDLSNKFSYSSHHLPNSHSKLS